MIALMKKQGQLEEIRALETQMSITLSGLDFSYFNEMKIKLFGNNLLKRLLRPVV